MAGRPNTAKVPDGPGPGAYDINDSRVKSGTVANRQKQSEKLLPARKNYTITPGPGMYELNESQTLIRNRSPQARIGTSKRITMNVSKRDDPGPGNYSINSARAGPSYGFAGKSKSRQSDNPGPGSYDFELSVSKVGQSKVKFGTSNRNT